MQRLQSIGVLQTRRAWSQVNPAILTPSWSTILNESGLEGAVAALQVEAAALGASYGAKTLAQQGFYEAPERFVNPVAFGGFASDGRSLQGVLYAAVPHTKNLIAGGMSPTAAKAQGGKFAELVVKTQVADAGRAAAGVDTAARPRMGYVRMLNPPSCARCSILAGKFYRWNAGFKRHPGCDCIHIPSRESVAGDVTTDPYSYFESLSESDQDRIYGKGSAQAVRDGGDIFQVVNAERGVKPGGLVTREGTTRRGNYGAGRQPRLTPDGIYAKNLSREKTLDLLQTNGYILPGGQNPTGVLRGDLEGFGQLGRGGNRVGARRAVEEARRTGVRDPMSRATMTAAERRAFDAQANWDAVRAGRNPFTNARDAAVTPDVAARVEREYRKEILGY
ncbi:hypothetical protein PTW37_06545 [Arthrobacter agilis]|uniref:hypothetical protein n=1 Tax=Arthrobacter agilis TaxID=37921 RepID=UPI002365CCCA|nr:hypothetical protein [Arthrobacter agilis]WDF34553.1 hypothetical protein PTW37_06545 [Arthrobacter agilis]